MSVINLGIGILSTEQRLLIRNRSFTPDRPAPQRTLQDILDLLKSERATGKIIINLSQGSIGSIQFEESTKL